MNAGTAERLTALALRMSDDLNGMVRDIQANEPDHELVRLQQAIGRVMWTIYFEILRPAFEEHPSLEPEAGAGAGPVTKIPPAPRGTRSAVQPARTSPRRRRLRQP